MTAWTRTRDAVHVRGGSVRPIARWICSVAIASSVSISAAAQSASPLPNAEEFIAHVRAHLRSDEDLQRQYTYLERRQRIRVSKLGKVHLDDTRLFEVYPSPERGQTYRRLLSIDDHPLSPDDLHRRDEARQKLLADRSLIRARETPAERASRERTEAQARQEQQEIVDDVFRTYALKPTDRDLIDGRRAIVIEVTPRPGATVRSQLGKYFSKVHGRAWVGEDDFQVMKVELQAAEDILVGWGLLARIHKGSQFSIERRRINNEVWLPSSMRISLAGRSLLLRSFRVDALTEFFDYRKFTVDAREDYRLPAK